ncbi:hypothetical protein [Imhoffiella purpurea]|nr:hypothetical protein [Imhoffiella purpurea]
MRSIRRLGIGLARPGADGGNLVRPDPERDEECRMRPRRLAFEGAMPAPHTLIVEPGGAEHRDPQRLVDQGGVQRPGIGLEQAQDEPLLVAQLFDLLVDGEESALEDRPQPLALVPQQLGDALQARPVAR